MAPSCTSPSRRFAFHVVSFQSAMSLSRGCSSLLFRALLIARKKSLRSKYWPTSGRNLAMKSSGAPVAFHSSRSLALKPSLVDSGVSHHR